MRFSPLPTEPYAATNRHRSEVGFHSTTLIYRLLTKPKSAFPAASPCESVFAPAGYVVICVNETTGERMTHHGRFGY